MDFIERKRDEIKIRTDTETRIDKKIGERKTRLRQQQNYNWKHYIKTVVKAAKR